MRDVEIGISKGVIKKVSPLIYNELFKLVNNDEGSSDLQRFNLKVASNGVQLIEQTEEGSKKKKIHILLTLVATKEKIVALRDGDTLTMLLESESNQMLKKYTKRTVKQ